MTDFVPFAPPDAEPFYGEHKAAPEAPPQPRNFAAEAAMKVERDRRFRRFLADRYELAEPLTPERATQRLRSVLGISSRRELNDDSAAAERWRRLRNEFEGWLRASEPREKWTGARSRYSTPRGGEA